MRNNPTNPSSLDAFDKLARAEKQVDTGPPEPPLPPRRSIISRSQPPTPYPFKNLPGSPIISLPAPALLVKNPDRMSDMAYSIASAGTADHLLRRASNLDAHSSLPPHPPLYRNSVGHAI